VAGGAPGETLSRSHEAAAVGERLHARAPRSPREAVGEVTVEVGEALAWVTRADGIIDWTREQA